MRFQTVRRLLQGLVITVIAFMRRSIIKALQLPPDQRCLRSDCISLPAPSLDVNFMSRLANHAGIV